MTSENIENIKIKSKTTGRTSRIRSKFTERTSGTRSMKKRKSHPKMSDSVPNCKHSLQKLKTEVLIPNSLEVSDFPVLLYRFLFSSSNQIQLFPSCFRKMTRK